MKVNTKKVKPKPTATANITKFNNLLYISSLKLDLINWININILIKIKTPCERKCSDDLSAPNITKGTCIESNVPII